MTARQEKCDKAGGNFDIEQEVTSGNDTAQRGYKKNKNDVDSEAAVCCEIACLLEVCLISGKDR